MENTLSSVEAAQLLNVSQATLYAYVSRGLLHPLTQGKSRSKRYLRDEVLRLAARQQDGRRAGHVAERAVTWGLPIMESRITSVDNGVLRYRGQEVMALARQASFEQVAQLLWESADADAFAVMHPALSAAAWRTLRDSMDDLAPLPRAMALLPAALPYLPHSLQQNAAQAKRLGAACIQLVASAALGVDVNTEPMERQIARAWQLPSRTEAMLRAALIACADHELNPSTFAARCVASTGADLHLVIAAGLASFSGYRHGGESLRVRALFDAAIPGSESIAQCCERLRGHTAFAGMTERLPGFGHPLYPDGDPRGKLLLEMLPAAAPHKLLDIECITSLAAAGYRHGGHHPNVDFGLAALERVLDLPAHSGQILFAISRTAGWVAHAMEQCATGQLIRPRARYVGSFG